jgi:hypothetical protein
MTQLRDPTASSACKKLATAAVNGYLSEGLPFDDEAAVWAALLRTLSVIRPTMRRTFPAYVSCVTKTPDDSDRPESIICNHRNVNNFFVFWLL